MSQPHVVHMTSVHPRDDTRIWLKMCRVVADAGFPTTLIVADGLGDDDIGGVSVVDVGRRESRLARMLGSTKDVLAKALALDGDIYHFHDPELLPVGLVLKERGRIVVYDAHEDLGADVRTKHYIPAMVRGVVAAGSDAVERLLSGRLTAVVGATPVIAGKFRDHGIRAIEVNNFPWAHELVLPEAAPMPERPRDFIYVGGIGIDRGVSQMVSALELVRGECHLNIAGSFSVESDQAVARALPGWDKVRSLGQRSRADVARLLGTARAGLVLFQPLANNVAGRPNKLFEYMSAGLPVIASDFPGWRDIVEGCGCGLLVDPCSPAEIAKAMEWVLDNPDQAEAMGKRGRQAILDRYSWDAEAVKLLALYAQLTNSRGLH